MPSILVKLISDMVEENSFYKQSTRVILSKFELLLNGPAKKFIAQDSAAMEDLGKTYRTLKLILEDGSWKELNKTHQRGFLKIVRKICKSNNHDGMLLLEEKGSLIQMLMVNKKNLIAKAKCEMLYVNNRFKLFELIPFEEKNAILELINSTLISVSTKNDYLRNNKDNVLLQFIELGERHFLQSQKAANEEAMYDDQLKMKQAFDTACTIGNDCAEVFSVIGKFYSSEKNNQSALKYYKKAIRIHEAKGVDLMRSKSSKYLDALFKASGCANTLHQEQKGFYAAVGREVGAMMDENEKLEKRKELALIKKELTQYEKLNKFYDEKYKLYEKRFEVNNVLQTPQTMFVDQPRLNAPSAGNIKKPKKKAEDLDLQKEQPPQKLTKVEAGKLAAKFYPDTLGLAHLSSAFNVGTSASAKGVNIKSAVPMHQKTPSFIEQMLNSKPGQRSL